MGKKKEEPQPEPEPVKVPSRGTLLNKWAARQDKLQKLVGLVAETKKELVVIAQLLHEQYGVLVQDSTHTVTLPTRTTTTQQAPEGAEGDAAEGGEPVEPLDPARNPLAKSPVPVVGPPSTQPVTEKQVTEIREGATLEKGAHPEQFQQDVATQWDRVVRLGLGKAPPGKVGPQ